MKKICLVTLIFGSLLVISARAENLESVLKSMDTMAANFKTAQTDFVWDQFQRVVNETDTQSGTMYFRRQGDNVNMAADITSNPKKYLVFSDGKIRVYQPSIDQVTEYNAGKNRGDFESYMVLGFGGSGKELQSRFDVRYLGSDPVGAVTAAKLELVPKSQGVKSMFSKIVLWIDPAKGLSVQQQFFEPSGDYRLVKYSNIKTNQKLPDDVFKLKTTGKTKTVRPQSS